MAIGNGAAGGAMGAGWAFLWEANSRGPSRVPGGLAAFLLLQFVWRELARG